MIGSIFDSNSLSYVGATTLKWRFPIYIKHTACNKYKHIIENIQNIHKTQSI